MSLSIGFDSLMFTAFGNWFANKVSKTFVFGDFDCHISLKNYCKLFPQIPWHNSEIAWLYSVVVGVIVVLRRVTIRVLIDSLSMDLKSDRFIVDHARILVSIRPILCKLAKPRLAYQKV